MELILIKINSKEWEFMWEWLANHPFNDGIENPSLALNNNEGWRYTGSYKEGNRVISTFRHRCHPLTNEIKDLSVSHDNFDENDIEKRFKL